MRRLWRSFWGNSEGAVAPIVALSLTALIAVGGVAFDYAHLAAMDTELQDAADHAALAAATQLDGEVGAQTRATNAAQSLITNKTRFAAQDATHDQNVGIAQVTFYSVYNDTTKTVATGDTDSNFVQVQVDVRAANYAFTPIVAAFRNSLDAKAVAGVSGAVCGVVPFFICNPVEPANNTDVNLPPGGVNPGTGIVMAQGGTQWGPGNFGFLDQIGNGANGVAQALASNVLLGNCQPTSGVTTETGNVLNAVRDSLNMRFDIKPVSASACPNGSTCQPSNNVFKDVAKTASGCTWNFPNQNLTDVTTNANPPAYFPRDNAPLSGVTPQTMGSPRDICHYFQNLAGNFPLCANNRVGNGIWDRAAYFAVNHPGVNWQTDPELGPNVTRYQTYLWEAEDATRLRSNPLSGTSPVQSTYGAAQNVCLGPGLAPDPSGIDRRRITAAVVNCHAVPSLNGKRNLPVAGFIDVFLVEPSWDRFRCTTGGNPCTTNPNSTNTFTIPSSGTPFKYSYGSRNDIYVEVIGASGTGQGGAIPQITRRDVPRLIE